MTFFKPKFIVFLIKKSQTSASKVSGDSSCRGLSWNAWKFSLRLYKHGFVLLNRLRVAVNTIFRNPKTANYWKWSKEGFPSKNLCKYIVKSHTLLAEERSLILSSLVQKLRMSITFWPIGSRHLTLSKKYDDFWFSGTESFPTMYGMNHFTAKFFSGYYTLGGGITTSRLLS